MEIKVSNYRGPIWTIKAVIDNMANSDEIIWGSLAGEKEGDYNNKSLSNK